MGITVCKNTTAKEKEQKEQTRKESRCLNEPRWLNHSLNNPAWSGALVQSWHVTQTAASSAVHHKRGTFYFPIMVILVGTRAVIRHSPFYANLLHHPLYIIHLVYHVNHITVQWWYRDCEAEHLSIPHIVQGKPAFFSVPFTFMHLVYSQATFISQTNKDSYSLTDYDHYRNAREELTSHHAYSDIVHWHYGWEHGVLNELRLSSAHFLIILTAGIVSHVISFCMPANALCAFSCLKILCDCHATFAAAR